MRQQILQRLALLGVLIDDGSGDTVIGQALMRADDGVVETEAVDLAVTCDPHVADHGQPVDLGVQGTQTVGDLLRQHRDDPPREVDRSRTLVSLAVE